MRKLPSILAGVFIAITLTRVQQYSLRMGGGWLGWLFSIAMGAGVFLGAYWTRDSITAKDGKQDARAVKVKSWAFVMLAFFVVADGLYNLAEVFQSVKPDWKTDTLLWIGTAVYGAFPTLATAGLAALQGHIDRLPKPPANDKTNVMGAVKRWMVARLTPAETVKVEPVAVMLPAKVDKPAPVAEKPKPVTVEPLTYAEFVSVNHARNGKGPMTTAEIVSSCHVSERTAYRWQKQYKGG